MVEEKNKKEVEENAKEQETVEDKDNSGWFFDNPERSSIFS